MVGAECAFRRFRQDFEASTLASAAVASSSSSSTRHYPIGSIQMTVDADKVAAVDVVVVVDAVANMVSKENLHFFDLERRFWVSKMTILLGWFLAVLKADVAKDRKAPKMALKDASLAGNICLLDSRMNRDPRCHWRWDMGGEYKIKLMRIF